MAQSRVVFDKTGDKTHDLVVLGEPDKVVTALRGRWAQLNRAEEGAEPNWVWVNPDQVLYVEPEYEGPPFVS